MPKMFYEAPELELVSFETAEDITTLSSWVDSSTQDPSNPKDNDISAGLWN